MLGGFNIISATNGISEILEGADKVQKNSFIVHADTDINIKTVNESTVKLFDKSINAYIDVHISYARRNIFITPKAVTLIPGRTYTIQIMSGATGVKSILGSDLEEDIIYDIVFNDKVILKKPIIMSPAANSTTDSVTVTIDYGDADSCIIEIDDDIKFPSPVYTEEVFVGTFTPSYDFANKQYYIRAKAKKTFVDESTSETIKSESQYTSTVQFFFQKEEKKAPAPAPSYFFISKSKPDNNESFVSDRNIMLLMNQDLSQYTVNVTAYTSELNTYDFYKEDPLAFVAAGVLTEAPGTVTVSRNLIRFQLNRLETTKAYYIHVLIEDDGMQVYEDVTTFVTSSRLLYIDYDYIKGNVQNFDVDVQYVMEKVQKACDMADYLSASRIRPDRILFKVKEYVRHKALLDIIVDYQLGYIQMINGAIGTFQFQLSSANVSSVESAIKQLTAQVKLWEAALKGYEKPGHAAPDFAVRGGDTGPVRSEM